MRGVWTAVVIVSTLVLPEIASGADLPAPPPAPAYNAPVAAPAYDWSGFYLGVNGGWALGHSQATNADPGTPLIFGLPITNSYNVSGALAGGTIGYNWQFGNWVVGAEGDMAWADLSGSANDIPPFTTAVVNETDEKWLATGRLRLGVTATDNWLIYASGGFAVASVETLIKTPLFGTFSETDTQWGWTAGAGTEVALSQNWLVKLEYLYVGLSDGTYFSPHIVLPTGATLTTRTVSLNNNVVRAGFSYKFN